MSRKALQVSCLLLWIIQLSGAIDEYYRPLPYRLGSSGIDRIDYIYLLNLDQRPERWTNCLNQLLPYGIFPERFPAIYGWSLSPETLAGISLHFTHGMWTGPESVMHFPLDGDGTPRWVNLSGADYGKGCFSGWTVKGTIGCSLSHLSILQDAYNQGYETIWVMEDDIWVVQDPHQLSCLIQELDELVGADQWDLLYTNRDFLPSGSEIPVYYWRPDMPGRDVRFLAENIAVGEHFMKIGSRSRMHSTIYRRCGMEKILNFYREHGNFLPYDVEIALVPGIQLYTVLTDIVSLNEVDSDTRARRF